MFMDAGCDIDAGLGRLFEAGLELALAIQADAMAAERPDARAKLAAAFHRVARSVRQTAALKARLLRDAERARRDALAHAEDRREARVARRKAAVSAAIERLIETEVEEDEQFDAAEDLSVRLEREALDEGFLDEPVAAQIARICQALQLPSPLAGEGAGERRDPDAPASDPASDWSPASAGISGEPEFDAAPPPGPRPSG